MQHKWYLTILGVTLLGTLTCLQVQQASAASTTASGPGISSTLAYTHTRQYSPFGDGFAAGYNDCGNQLPPDTHGRGPRYTNGYNQGYNFCQSERAKGSIAGNTEGYNAGYQQCQQERSNPTTTNNGVAGPGLGSFAPPSEQGHDPAFSAAFAQGYNACEQQYGTSSQPLYNGAPNQPSYNGAPNQPSYSGTPGQPPYGTANQPAYGNPNQPTYTNPAQP